MEILGKLGIDIHLLIAQIINFIILLFILNKFVYKPILKEIEEKNIEDNKKQKELEEKENQLKSQLEEARNEIIKSKKKANNIIKEAEILAEQIKLRTQEEIETEKRKVFSQIKKLSEK